MNNKAKILAEKLLALAKRGEFGEQENAEQALKRHLAKYGLTISEFEADEQLVFITFQVDVDKNELIEKWQFDKQIIASVIGGKRIKDDTVIQRKKNILLVDVPVSIAEKIEIESKIDVYWKDFLAQLEIFRSAYIQKNQLYALPTNEKVEAEPLTPEQFAEQKKLFRMMEGIDYKTYRKELSNG